MKVAVIQMTSVLDFKENLKQINFIISKAKNENNIDYFFLPEMFYSMSNCITTTPYLVSKNNEHYENIKLIATSNKVHIIGGTAATEDGNSIYNRTYSFDPDGNEYPSYDKINLFSINSTKQDIDESKVYTKGRDIVDFRLTDDWHIGLSVCFDLRFSSHYRELFNRKSNLITVSSAFTVPTGRAHWEVLLRARAIETQSYVIASDQVGIHNEKITTYGHSMIIDPWGEVLVSAKDEIGYIFSELDLQLVQKVRSRINMIPVSN